MLRGLRRLRVMLLGATGHRSTCDDERSGLARLNQPLEASAAGFRVRDSLFMPIECFDTAAIQTLAVAGLAPSRSWSRVGYLGTRPRASSAAVGR